MRIRTPLVISTVLGHVYCIENYLKNEKFNV